jgi:putative transposase
VKTFEYRLFTTREQERLLLSCLIASRHLYNEMLEAVKAEYEASGKFLSKYDLTARFKGRGADAVPATTVQTLADRLAKSLKRFLARKELSQKVGFPRFKSANQWHSIGLRQYGQSRDVWMEDGRLRVPAKLGKSLKIKMHRPLEGTPKTAYLVLRADGHWYVLIVCETDPEPLPVSPEEVGIDLGLKVFLADSDGDTVDNPRWYRSAQKTLARKQRALCRCKRGSRRRRKAARNVAKTHLKIARQRKDFLHKVSRSYVNRYQTIVLEDLNISGMVRNHPLAKSIVDASWSAFVAFLTYKAENAGRQVVAVPAHFTSQKCFSCGELVPKSLSVRTHVCGHCGYVEDRDINAAKNILRAGTRPLEGNVSGCAMRSPRSPAL